MQKPSIEAPKPEKMTETQFSQRETKNSKSRQVNLEKKLEEIKKEVTLPEYDESNLMKFACFGSGAFRKVYVPFLDRNNPSRS